MKIPQRLEPLVEAGLVDYTEGRRVNNSRRARAMEKGSRYGRKAKEEAWQSTEVDALCPGDPGNPLRKRDLVALQERHAAPGDRAHRALRARRKALDVGSVMRVVDDALKEEAKRQLYRQEMGQK